MELSVVHFKREGDYLYVTVQGKNVDAVISSTARKLAYDIRGQHGFDNAGIEGFGGPYPVDMSQKDEDGVAGKPVDQSSIVALKDISARKDDLAYRNTFRITRNMV